MYRVIIGEQDFPTLVARTAEEHERGLMFRKWPPPVMCFPYKEAAYRKFWMKNTPSPLDIIFCRAGKIVSIHKGEPHSTTMVGPNEPTDFVVEFPFGTAEDYGFKPGQEIIMSRKTIDYDDVNKLAAEFINSI